MTLINLSSFNSDSKNSNSEWTNTLPKAITVKNGASISLKQAFLDINTSGQYQVISINQDITIGFTFGFAVLYTPDIIDPLLENPKPTQPNQLYIARDITTKKPILNTKNIPLPAGEYGAQDLSLYLTAKMTEFTSQDISDFIGNSNQFMRDTNYIPRLMSPDIDAIDNDYIIQNFVSVALYNDDPVLDLFQVGDTVTFNCYDRSNKDQITINGGQITNIESTVSPTGTILTIETTIFNPGNRNPEILDAGSTYTEVNLTIPAKSSKLTFYNQSDINDVMTFADNPAAAPLGVLVGSSQVGLLFNNNNSSRFELLAHSPLYEKTSDVNPSIYAYKDAGSSNILFADKFACTPFFNLTPTDFWGALGFDLDSCLVKNNDSFSAIVPQMTTGINCTGGFVTYDTLIGSTRANYAIPASTYWYNTSLFKNILAVRNYTSTSTGYYLIELGNLVLPEYIDDNNTKNTIFSVASRNYDTSGYITVYPGNEIRGVYIGEDYQISSISVRILDPTTMNPINDAILGTNNSVYIELLNPDGS